MRFTERILAAIGAFSGHVPQGKAEQHPLFFNFSVGMVGQPTQNTKINHQMLRNFSETAVVRRAIDYIRNQVVRLDWDIDAIGDTKLTAADKKQVELAKACLLNPNPDDNFASWLGQLIEDCLVIGQAYNEVKLFKGHEKDHPYLFYPVDAASMQIYIDWDGSTNKPKYAQFDLKGNRVDFTPQEMSEIIHNKRSNTPFGLSPTESSIQQIQYLLEAQAFAGKTASNATPKKLLFMGQDASQPQIQEFRQYFRDEIEGRSHLPIVGGTDDIKTVELGLAGDSALFLQWQSFLIGIIASCFNLDIMKFNAIVGINRSTGDTLDDQSDEGAIRPMAMQMEHFINANILPLFDLDGKAKFQFRYTTSFQDRKSLAVIHQIYGQMDVLTINEMRRELGKPELAIDPVLGYSKGDLTISEYRAAYGEQRMQDSVGLDGDFNHKGMIDVQEEMAQSKLQDSQTKRQVANQKKSANDPNNNGGNNSVHGAKRPKEKAMNQRNDKGLDATL